MGEPVDYYLFDELLTDSEREVRERVRTFGDTEIRPMGVHSIEFDNAGTAVISFVAVTPGRYTLSVPGSSGESQQAVFNIQ